MALSAGDCLGPYEILAPHGAAGQSELYSACDTRLGREVVIVVSTDQFSETFERRARAVTALHHPHIRALYEVGPYYLVMEPVGGVPLKGPLSLEETLRFAAEICDALDYAQQRGIAHGDLKPENILVTPQGVKLLDFGLTDRTPSSDIYAFGCVLHEMLMGRPVTEHRRPVQPAALEKILQKCLEPDPAQRFQSAGEIKQALAGVSQGRGYRREYTIVAGSVAMLIAGLALLVMQFPFYQKLSGKDILVLGDFTNTTGDAIFDGTLRAALAIQLQQSPLLKIMDDQNMRQDLRLMGRPPGTRISNVIAHDICVREGRKAMINGAIADLGKTFSITVQAIDCQNGATLAREQVQAEGRNQVLNKLSQAAAGLRVKLGEPPSSAQRPDRVTTASIDALQAYALGEVQRSQGNSPESIRFFQHAIDLDPNFALAELSLARAWAMAGDIAKAKQAYRDFFARSKDADAASPLLAQARKEFAALR